MPSKPRSATAARRAVAPGLAGLAVALVLIGLALPRCLAAWNDHAGAAALWDLRAGKPGPDPAILAAAGESLVASARRPPRGEVLADGGYLLARAAENTADPARRAALSRAALVATERGLALAPANASAWARLAALRANVGDRDGAAAALRVSFLAGPVVPALTASRLDLALALLPALDGETRVLLDRQIRITWILEPARIARLAEDRRLGRLIGLALDGVSEEDLTLYRRAHPTP
ncbi:hypothetical protein CKO38_00585 [Rhodospirillum rubrum]|uniref:hypothetical protein n=1 Tax=Rhodospirillum rubrum TaxID=1085 RepID=UPI0019064532|nr:hypothetical protein [Rhodospirillum rubrum]MBK1663173.1 hypothetical protein [Rhodospirillum rubrum]MBK1675190.1 hypothetical protein [Rhodospirillum rubrum]